MLPRTVYFVLLAQIHTIFGLGSSTPENHEVPAKLDEISSKVVDYLTPFVNCTTMVFSQEKISWGSNPPTLGPIMSLVYDTKTTLVTGKMIQDKFSIARRLNPAPHCWATFTILPEKAAIFEEKKYALFFSLLFFIYTKWHSHYFVIMTSVKHKVEIYFEQTTVLAHLDLMEVVLVDVTREDNSILRLQYLNPYQTNQRTTGLEPSEAWHHIHCEPADCFDRLVQLGKNVSRRSKYFWTTEGNPLQPYITKLNELFGNIDIQSLLGDRQGYKKIADVTSFNGFLSLIVLQDVLIYDFQNLTPFHIFEKMYRMTGRNHAGIGFLIYDNRKYSFVSCHGIRSSSEMLESLSSPFDVTSWICIGICFITVVLILTSMLGRFITDGMLLVVGISLENSVLDSISVYDAIHNRKGYPSFQTYFVTAIWTILAGTILTNWYKSVFTMEMIVPTIYKSPWTGVLGMEGIRILMPFNLLGGREFTSDYFRYKYFYLEIFNRCNQISKSNGDNAGNKKTAKGLALRLLPYFGIYPDLGLVGNGTFSRMGSSSNPPPYNKSALQNYPIQPVEYDDTDSFEVIKSLRTKCCFDGHK
ncbi:hypothetical protein Fcan01_19257 [Folsomia candida]|uniref:Uncharacterized protein n=1 Tax=Folsomia candida TaxID=158441 RepID=A0A226DNT7_FOLCA|nr:hypothetical protein Fcan01_19257 [Folsomia candida]